MARRPPAFVRNPVGVHHVNVAHGLYPREPMTAEALDRLADALSTSATTAGGRIYAGGLTKFEPGEMARLAVPSIELLAAGEVAAKMVLPPTHRSTRHFAGSLIANLPPSSSAIRRPAETVPVG